MEKIVKFLEKVTNATRTYKSFKYCFESIDLPSITYDDKQGIVFKPENNGESDKGLKKSKSIEERALQAIELNEQPLFNYFLDGSRRTYKVDDIAYSKRLYPIIAGQIGVACCVRNNDFKCLKFDRQLVLVLPSCACSDGSCDLFFNEKIKELNDLPFLLKNNIQFNKILYYKDEALKEGETYENKGIAKIQNEMVEAEKNLVSQLVQEKKLNVFSFLLKDGSLEYTKTTAANSKELSKLKSNYQCVVGVSKSFNPELCKNNKEKSIAQDIAELPLYYRTPAYRYSVPRISDVTFSAWYLRIRDINRTTSPFDGVVKIEKILVTDKENEQGLDSDDIDRISAHIINERNPTCYGSDNRWANHLYPIYLTEAFIKSQYLSNSYFLNLF